MGLIDADKAAKAAASYSMSYVPCLSEYEKGCADTWENAASFIHEFKTEEAEPVTHAHWVHKHRHYGGINYRTGQDEYGELHTIQLDDRFEEDTPFCSFCGRLTREDDPEYCPHCGAIMDEVIEETEVPEECTEK